MHSEKLYDPVTVATFTTDDELVEYEISELMCELGGITDAGYHIILHGPGKVSMVKMKDRLGIFIYSGEKLIAKDLIKDFFAKRSNNLEFCKFGCREDTCLCYRFKYNNS